MTLENQMSIQKTIENYNLKHPVFELFWLKSYISLSKSWTISIHWCFLGFLEWLLIYSGDLKFDHLDSGLFEGLISNGLVFKWSGLSYQPFEIWT